MCFFVAVVSIPPPKKKKKKTSSASCFCRDTYVLALITALIATAAVLLRVEFFSTAQQNSCLSTHMMCSIVAKICCVIKLL